MRACYVQQLHGGQGQGSGNQTPIIVILVMTRDNVIVNARVSGDMSDVPDFSPSRPASMTINLALTTLTFLLFRSQGRPRRNRRSKPFRSHYGVDVRCIAVRMHGHVSLIDKCWASEVDYSYTDTELPLTHIHPHPPIFTCPLHFVIPDDE